MAYYYSEPSHTFSEYLLVPGYSDANCIPSNVSLTTPVVKFRRGETPSLSMNIPLVSAIMQSVSDDRMAIALAKEGGISFIYGSQTIEAQAEMVRRVKGYKAGFVTSDSNIRPDGTLAEVLALKERLGHSTIAVTDDGTSNGKLVGVVTSRDYRVSRMSPDEKVATFMTPFEKLVTAPEGTSLKEANDIIWEHKLNSLPIIDEDGRLVAFVFRKDYDQHKENPHELLDAHKRYVVGAGINTRDYAERVPALVEAGADVLCIDSSEGSSRSGSAAAPSASRARRRASAADRRRLSSRWQKRVMNILRKQESMFRFVRMEASFWIIISRLRLPWAVISVCSAGIFPALMKVRPVRSWSTAAI